MASVMVLVGAAACAQANLSARFDLVDNSSCGQLAGYVTQDLVVDTTTDWLTAQIILSLDSPGIYQDPFGNEQSPNPILFQFAPALEYDTYISNGTLGQNCAVIPPSGLGGSEVIFDDTQLSIAWYTTRTDEIGRLDLARITVGEQRMGGWRLQVTAAPAPGPKIVLDGRLIDGTIYMGGDLNADRSVGQDDLDIILSHWGNYVAAGSTADPSGDGRVGQDDLDTVLRDWGYGLVPPPDDRGHPLPGPAPVVVLVVGSLLLNRRRRNS